MKRMLAMLLCLVLAVSFMACGEAETQDTTAAQSGETQTIGETQGTGENQSVDGTTGTTPEIPEGFKRFSVIVVHKDGSKNLFVYNTDQQYLGIVLESEGLISGNAGPYGLEIITVDGESAVYSTDRAYWAIYVGDEYAMTGIDAIEIESGAQYRLEYTGA